MAIEQLRLLYQGNGNYEFDIEGGKAKFWASAQDVVAYRQMEALESIAQSLEAMAEQMKINNDIRTQRTGGFLGEK